MGIDSRSHTRAGALRGELLRARTREHAVQVAVASVRDLLGLPTTSDAITVLAGGPTIAASLAWLPRANADDAAAEWMRSIGVDGACAITLSSTSGDTYGQLMIAAESAAIDAARDELHLVAADLAEALEIAAISEDAREAARLREALRRRDELVREAGEALIRDASEVVRVVAELEERDERINDALQAALRFQKAMVAPLPNEDGLALSAVYLPAEMISGDFYDVAVMGPHWIRVFIADATGHGVAAGLATMFIKSEYEAHKRASESPAIVLRTINERLSATYQNLELKFTALCLDIHTAQRRLVYASAAHPGPMLRRGSVVETLSSGGPFMGVTTGVAFPEYEQTIERGDLLLAFTDGLTDADAMDGSLFGDSGVVRALEEAARESPDDASAASAALVRGLAAFVGEGRRLADDVTFIAIASAVSASSD